MSIDRGQVTDLYDALPLRRQRCAGVERDRPFYRHIEIVLEEQGFSGGAANSERGQDIVIVAE
ncbi:MAG: hypothetical protein OEN02_01150 [Gammaproteobacteria bacterium]|nr:hypothetical protein [Gammaproteobacteria bacterium]